MKLLLTIIMSTVVTASAFAACSLSTPQECSSQTDCTGLNALGDLKFTFNAATTPKCMSAETSVTQGDCLPINDSRLGKNSLPGAGADTQGTAVNAK